MREAYDEKRILSELSNQVRTIVETEPLLKTVGQQISDTVPNLAMLVKDNGCYAPAYALGYAEPLTVSFEESAGIIRHLEQNCDPLRVYHDDPDSWLYREPGVREEERERLRISDVSGRGVPGVLS